MLVLVLAIFKPALDEDIVIKCGNSTEENSMGRMVCVGEGIRRYKRVHNAEHCVLHRGGGIKMSPMANRMFWGVDRVKGIGPHNPIMFSL